MVLTKQQRPSNGPTATKVRTLLGYVRSNHWALRTTPLGRAIFLALATALILYALRASPSSYLPQLAFFCAFGAAMPLLGVRHILCSRPVFMLLATCCVVGVVNALLPPENVNSSMVTRATFGIGRGVSYAALSFGTLTVAAITRPSDMSRFAARFTSRPWVLLILAIPFTCFSVLAQSFSDLRRVNSVRYAHLGILRRTHDVVIGMATGLLAMALCRAMLLYQAAHILLLPSASGAPTCILARRPLLSLEDLALLIPLVPGTLLMIGLP